jgi:hypothetical protein
MNIDKISKSTAPKEKALNSLNFKNNMKILAKRFFSIEDAHQFSMISGDRNPIHLDTKIARRSVHGECILQGILGVLWGLEVFVSETNIIPTNLKIKFLKPIFFNSEIECKWDQNTKIIYLEANGFKLFSIQYAEGVLKRSREKVLNKNSSMEYPDNPSFEQCIKMQNSIFPLVGDIGPIDEMFPTIVGKYGKNAIYEFAALSTIVGMKNPGLNSLFIAIDVNFQMSKHNKSSFSLLSYDSRFNLIKLKFEATTMIGTITALYLPITKPGLEASEIKKSISPKIFEEVNALIIGGSRGVGEIVAKIISMGGGRVTITYKVGFADAESIRNEIASEGGLCQIRQFSIDSNPKNLLSSNNFNQIYYFASPKILNEKSKALEDLEMKYRKYFITAFQNVCFEIVRLGLKPSIFYPSTSYVSHPEPSYEIYSRIKNQGEIFCKDFSDSHALKIQSPRLPRIETDQTRSILNEKFEDPIQILFPLLLKMRNKS